MTYIVLLFFYFIFNDLYSTDYTLYSIHSVTIETISYFCSLVQWHIQSFFGQTGKILEFPLPLSATMVTCYLNEWKHFCRQSLLSIRRLLFIFCLLSHFNFFNVFLCWIAAEKKEVKKPFLGTKPVYRVPKRPGYITVVV